MATNITIKRYNGSSWDELSPATSIGQVSGLENRLTTIETGKQDISNLVTSVSSSSTDAQYPSAKLFYDTTTSIMETAEGKTATYTTDVYVSDNKKYLLFGQNQLEPDTTITSSTTGVQTVEITSSTDSFSLYDLSQEPVYYYEIVYDRDNYVYKVKRTVSINSLKTGDILLITDLEVPDFWCDGRKFYKLETSKVDLSNYVTTNTTQTGLTGDKTTNGTFTFNQTGHTNKVIISEAMIKSIAYGDNYVQINGYYIMAHGEGNRNNETLYKYSQIVNDSAILTLPTTSGTLVIDSDLATYAPKASPTFTGTVELPTTTKITGITSTGNVVYTNGVLSVDTTSYVPTTRTVNGKALSSDITLSASDVSALPSSTAYLASVGLSSDSRTLTITPSSGNATSFDNGNITTLNSTAPTSSKTGDIWFQTSA